MATKQEALLFIQELKTSNPSLTKKDALVSLTEWKAQQDQQGQSISSESFSAPIPQDPNQGIADEENRSQGFVPDTFPGPTQSEMPVQEFEDSQRVFREQRESGLPTQLTPEEQMSLPELDVTHQINPRARLSDQAEAVRSREQDFLKKKKGIDTKAQRERLGTGGIPILDRLNEVLFTREFTEGDRKFTTAIGGLLSLPARELGAVLGKGEVSEEATKLFKDEITEVKKWAEDRESQNINIDVLIDSLQDQLDKKTMPVSMAENVQANIDDLEDQKNSGVLTTTGDVLMNLFLETGSDPLFWSGAAVDVIRSVRAAKQGFATAEEVTGAAGKQLEEGTARAKTIAEKRLGGEKFQPVDEEFIEQGMSKAVSNLREEGLDISQDQVIGLPAASEAAAPKLISKAREETKKVQDLARQESAAAVQDVSQRKGLVESDIASQQEKIIQEGRAIESEVVSAKSKARDVLSDTPQKIGSVEESASVDIKVLEGRLDDLRKSVNEGSTGIQAFDALDNVRSSVKISKQNKKDVIGDVINSMSPGSGLSDDLIESIIEGRLISKDVVTGKPKRIGKGLTTTKEIAQALKSGGVDTRVKEMSQVIEKILNGDLNQMKEVFNTHADLFIASSKSGAKQKAKDVAGNSASIMNRIRDISDETLSSSLSPEKLAQFKRVAKKAKAKLTAGEDVKKLTGTSKSSKFESTEAAKVGSVGKAVKNIDDEGTAFFNRGLTDTRSMEKGLFPTIKDVKKKDFLKDIRVNGAKKAEKELRKKLQSKDITPKDIELAEKTDAILNTKYAEKMDNVIKRKGSQRKVQAEFGVAGQKIARRKESISKLEEGIEPLKGKVKKFDEEIKKIESQVDSKVSSAKSKETDLLNEFFKDNLDEATANLGTSKNIMSAVEGVTRQVALEGTLKGPAIDQLAGIDKILGTTLVSKAKKAGAAIRHKLKASGGLGDKSGSRLPSLTLSAGAVVPGGAKTVAAVQGIRGLANELKSKPVWKALKELSKQMSKVEKENLRIMISAKEVEKGRKLLMSEITGNKSARNIDALVRKGVFTWKQIAESMGREPFQKFIDKISNSKDNGERAASIRAKKALN